MRADGSTSGCRGSPSRRRLRYCRRGGSRPRHNRRISSPYLRRRRLIGSPPPDAQPSGDAPGGGGHGGCPGCPGSPGNLGGLAVLGPIRVPGSFHGTPVRAGGENGPAPVHLEGSPAHGSTSSTASLGSSDSGSRGRTAPASRGARTVAAKSPELRRQLSRGIERRVIGLARCESRHRPPVPAIKGHRDD